MTVRVRFAPSPTGYLHIGGVRTALFNWLFARKLGGQFILRIEDTDQKRFVEGSVEYITESLKWLGLDWDEGPDIGGPYGPYVQSERLEMYQEGAALLLAKGMAYKDFTSAEELTEMRAHQIANNLPRGYDGRHRDLSSAQIAAYEAEGRSYTVRFKAPRTGSTTFVDLIRGDIMFDNTQIQDQVLLKSDGFPTYHLANVIDDHHMQITHIMRGDEWVSTAPLHKLLHEAFGWEMPQIAHMPVILSPSGKGKLSKRDKNFQDAGHLVLIKLLDYRDEGFLPAAVSNWLANVGWNFGDDVEIFSIADAIPRFAVTDVNPAPSRLPFGKLEWVNNQHIQLMDNLELATLLKPILDTAAIEVNIDSLLLLIPALKPRLKRLSDAIPFMRFLDDAAYQPDPTRLAHKKMLAPVAKSAFKQTIAILQNATAFTAEALGSQLFSLGESVTENSKAGPFLGTLRYAITGQKISPPVFEAIIALGKARAITRLTQAINLIES